MREIIDFNCIAGPEPSAWENFELLCANLVECHYPGKQVSRVRPSPGDEGMDIVVGPIERPTHIFQCKYFMAKIGDSQRRQIKRSYDRLRGVFFRDFSWTLVTPIDPSPDELRWFDRTFGAWNPGEARRWWGKAHLFNLLSQHPRVADTYFDLPVRKRICEIHERIMTAPSDLDDTTALRIAYLFFDRPGFRLAFENEASIPDFDKAMKDTLLALNTGVLKTRDGVVIARGKPRSEFREPIIRNALDSAVRSIERITIALARAIEARVFTRYHSREDCWVFNARDPRALATAEDMNAMRNEVIRAMNHAFGHFGIQLLPEIIDKLDEHGYMGRSNHQFRAESDHLD